MAKAKTADAEQTAVDTLAPTHPNDPTETTLEQEAATVTDESQATAQAARLGYQAPEEPPA